VGTLIAAWSNGFFDVNSKRLDNQRHDLAADVAVFEKRKIELNEQNKSLAAENNQLQQSSRDLK